MLTVCVHCICTLRFHADFCLFVQKEAQLSWLMYLAKHGESVISDAFEGQLQSCIKCGKCNEVHACTCMQIRKDLILQNLF